MITLGLTFTTLLPYYLITLLPYYLIASLPDYLITLIILLLHYFITFVPYYLKGVPANAHTVQRIPY